MRIVRVRYNFRNHWGVLKGKSIHFLEGAPYSRIKLSGRVVARAKVTLLVPCEPRKIVLVGLNYRDHARELDMPIPLEPVIFLKPPTAVAAHGQAIVYPQGVSRLDYEAELALVVKRKGKDIPRNKVRDYILGYTCLNDVTARDLQQKDGQWTRAKSFDTFCPAGPWIETKISPDNLKISSWLNGSLKQHSSTSNFIFPLTYIVAFISHIMTLFPGDIISTGTPAGVGPMRRGDTIEIKIAGIGSLVNKIE